MDHCSCNALKWILTPIFLLLSVVVMMFLVHLGGDFSVPVLLNMNNTSLANDPGISLHQTHKPSQRSNSSLHNIKQRKRVKMKSRVQRELEKARMVIQEASSNGISVNESMWLDAKEHRIDIYRNRAAFFRSYAEMEKQFRVYVYEEGEPPLVHHGPCKDIYTTEGRFISELEQMQGGLRTRDPRRAHVFFLPFSVTEMVRFLYQPESYDHQPLQRFVADYVRVIASKHPFWNNTNGTDHFMLSCHDWGPHASRGNSQLYENSIRSLCNANISEGFHPYKDVSIPEINLKDGEMPRQLLSPVFPSRTFLAFFAGGVHGPIRQQLLQHWEGRDLTHMPVYNYLSEGLDYYSFMLRSHFCLCPSGYEVASPRIVEAIYSECIPVIISQGYVLPFSDVLRWEAFSISVAVEDIPRLREVLEGFTAEELEKLREGIRTIKQHFVFNNPPKKFDVFHMILHSVWLRRLNVSI
ncbi:Exostosin family protein [Rhynchospora pubera]|uniref:Exostosin family protein n=1 Tax=Rhynchospora pubera TaxID=906938 RepID=A0AAV8CF93_9POAL|nr:Exostosin family protein [Rhynchospora pubera]